mgnify:CR=1 FL=1
MKRRFIKKGFKVALCAIILSLRTVKFSHCERYIAPTVQLYCAYGTDIQIFRNLSHSERFHPRYARISHEQREYIAVAQATISLRKQ